MPRRLAFAPRAMADLDEIAHSIARDNPERAVSFIAELDATCRSAAAMPRLYPARDTLSPGLRMAVHRRYLIFYREVADENAVRIERVLHSARNLSRLF